MCVLYATLWVVHRAVHVQEFGDRVMFYLAAAVSDFYVPWPDLPEHKIQSRGGALNLQLQQVPKCLGLLRSEWAPAAFHVSFKLETDEQLLLKKSKAAITNYGMHCVVANELSTRTERCAFLRHFWLRRMMPLYRYIAMMLFAWPWILCCASAGRTWWQEVEHRVA